MLQQAIYNQLNPFTMKKTATFLAALAVGLIAVSSCQKESDDLALTTPVQKTLPAMLPNYEPGLNWINNFVTEDALLGSFHLFGNPTPVWVEEAFGREGLFDNMGASPTPGYGISKVPIGTGGPIIIESEIFLSIANPAGFCVCPGLGITAKPYNPNINLEVIPLGAYFRIMYAGSDATWVPLKNRGHAWIQAGYLNTQGKINSTVDYGINADSYANAWHIMKIVITQEHRIRFYINDELIWAPSEKIQANMLRDRNLLLGFTSSGFAGKAYHNYVKIVYPAIE